jgi:hypothetical protein
MVNKLIKYKIISHLLPAWLVPQWHKRGIGPKLFFPAANDGYTINDNNKHTNNKLSHIAQLIASRHLVNYKYTNEYLLSDYNKNCDDVFINYFKKNLSKRTP